MALSCQCWAPRGLGPVLPVLGSTGPWPCLDSPGAPRGLGPVLPVLGSTGLGLFVSVWGGLGHVVLVLGPTGPWPGRVSAGPHGELALSCQCRRCIHLNIISQCIAVFMQMYKRNIKYFV